MTATRSKFEIDISARIIRRAARGDASSFEVIYRAFRQPVFGLGRRICRSDAEAADVVQDVFLQVFQHLHRYRGDGPFWAWLRTIAIRKALDRTAVNAVYQLGMEIDTCVALSPAPDDGVAVRQALAQLPARTQLILWLNRVEGFTHEELSELTGMSVSHSKSVVSRALQSLARRHAMQRDQGTRGAA